MSQADSRPPLSEGHHVTGRMKDVMGGRDASENIQKDRKSGSNELIRASQYERQDEMLIISTTHEDPITFFHRFFVSIPLQPIPESVYHQSRRSIVQQIISPLQDL